MQTRHRSRDEHATVSPCTPADRCAPPRVLIFWEGGHRFQTLPPRGEVSIGRSESCDLRIDLVSISRRHARLLLDVDMRIEDLHSRNGTRLGGRPLMPGVPVPLAPGDIVEIGAAILTVQRGVPALARSPAGARQGPALPAPETRLPHQRLLELVAPGRLSVLLVGETGVGKEVAAETIARLSPRAARPLVRVNCAALSESLLESELFGYERGAFTGAVHSKPGLIEAASSGTFFLDEISEMPLLTQAKLLRVLEAREVLRIGALRPRPIDVRFIAATNTDLAAACAARTFREDLYYRINGVTVVIPPLRERVGEIRPLAEEFIRRACAEMGRPAVALADAAAAWLQRQPWPGNIRELRNVVERAVLLCQGEQITLEHLFWESRTGLPLAAAASGEAAPQQEPAAPAAPAAPPGAAPDPAVDLRRDLHAFERDHIVRALAQCAGNQTRAASLLGISRRTLQGRLNAYGLQRPRK